MFKFSRGFAQIRTQLQVLHRSKRFFLTFLLVSSILGVIAVSYIPQKSGVWASRGGVEREISVFCEESTGSDAIEVDGIVFETLVLERVWRIPAREEGAYTPIKLGAKITNNSAEAYRFTRFSLHADLIRIDRPIQTETQGFAIKIYESESSLVPLVKPGESVNLFVEGRLYWRDNQLNLDVRDGSGLTLRIWPLSPKENLFRFWHWREVSEMMVFNPNRNLIKGLWTGQAATNFVRITLVEN